ncbi:MarR family winged helix-turn-helix transcriptional regulator [Sinobaca sp. H24]|uniref:MarR family winged helix-turn-helix transcriptional regulator n=1 Tax=Sinobaca sp. H24 TaxID=2923376 RepID=UPI00207962FB|nr:MarR family winged helix-turn-helix transcriptional regulator [Sinobaca sp. H24]
MNSQPADIYRVIEITERIHNTIISDFPMPDLPLNQRQVSILWFVFHHQESSINDVARHFYISKSTASQAVSHLEKEQFLERTVNPVNRREVILQLLERGQYWKTKFKEAERQLHEKYFSKIPQEDVDKMQEALENIQAIVEKEKSKN